MINLETVSRIVYSIDAMARAKGIAARHELDTLVGVATRALAEGMTEPQAIERARQHAATIINANGAIQQMIERIGSQELIKQAL